MDDSEGGGSGRVVGSSTESEDRHSIMTPASERVQSCQSMPNASAPPMPIMPKDPDSHRAANAVSNRADAQLQEMVTIAKNLSEQLATQTQANEQLKVELATLHAEMAQITAAQDARIDSFFETLKSQRLTAEAQQDPIRTLEDLVSPRTSVFDSLRRRSASDDYIAECRECLEGHLKLEEGPVDQFVGALRKARGGGVISLHLTGISTQLEAATQRIEEVAATIITLGKQLEAASVQSETGLRDLKTELAALTVDFVEYTKE